VSQFHDERIKAFQTESNGVVAINRNFGIVQSKGDFIAFCDDDDVWVKNKLQKQFEVLSKSDAGICFSGYYMLDTKNKVLSVHDKLKLYQRKLSMREYLFSLGFICNSSVMIKRDVVKNIGYLDEDPKLRAVEDYEYYSKVIRNYKAVYIAECLVGYRRHDNSISNISSVQWLDKQVYLHKKLLNIHRDYLFTLYLKFVKIYLKYYILRISALPNFR
jgi:glycosyltransferase involved in cell wall biosynthesis